MIGPALLFVPADSEKKIAKAEGAGAGALILDLEDSVAESQKPAGRALAAERLAQRREGPALFVRINPVTSPHWRLDVEATAGHGPAGYVVPKARSAADLALLDPILAGTEIQLLPIVTEAPVALFHLGSYVGAPRLAGMSWGAEDLSAAVGGRPRDDAGRLTEPYRLARSLCLFAAAAAETRAVETVFPDFRDEAGLAAYAAEAARDGFEAMLAIHPGQVPAINAAFAPSAAAIAYAHRVVAAFADGAGVAALDGQMLDAPHLAAAKRVLARAARS